MKHSTLFVLLLGAVFGDTVSNLVNSKATKGQYIENSYLIKLKSTTRTTLDIHLEQVKSLFVERSGSDAIKHVYSNLGNNMYAAKFSKKVLNQVKSMNEVEYVEKDGVISVDTLQRDAPWGISRISQRKVMTSTNEWGLKYNYTYETTGEGVAVYIIDTGIRFNNTQFEGRAVHGANFALNNTSSDDEYGHGTHVAGIVGSARFGVLKKATLVSVKVLGPKGDGGYAEFIAGLDWAVADKRGKLGNVINVSLGGEKSQAMNDAVQEAYLKGATIVVSAGNSNDDSCGRSPASSPNAITVGATDILDRRSPFSCYGPCVDIFAPGNNIISTFNNKDTDMSGTSMATPHVAGLVGYFLALDPTLTNSQLVDKLKSSASKGLIYDAGKGSPNLLAYNLVEKAQ